MLSAAEIEAKIDGLLKNPPAFHEVAPGKLVNYGIDPRLVPLLREHVRPGHVTLETGSGISTVIFLILGAHHSTVTPNGGEAERIRAYCAEKGIATDHFTPVVASSETALPAMPAAPTLDAVLVDGNHAFPVPCMDWYYGARMLKKGGVMIVDDVQLWSGRILADFLDGEEVWQRLSRTNRFAAYRMLEDAPAVLSRGWWAQPYVAKHSGDGYSLAGKILRLFTRQTPR